MYVARSVPPEVRLKDCKKKTLITLALSKHHFPRWRRKGMENKKKRKHCSWKSEKKNYA